MLVMQMDFIWGFLNEPYRDQQTLENQVCISVRIGTA